MKAAIFNPYLDTLGGGERYSISFAKTLKEKGYEVFVQWKDSSIKEKLEKRFGISLSDINFISDIKRGDGYDLCFWVSDGSIPALKARKNYLHFQVPFKDIKGKSLINKMKLFRINKIICNSEFTKKVIDKEYGVESMVIYPPVPVEELKPLKKEKLILFVGRFSQLKQSKRQDILIDGFKKFYNKGHEDWKLVLVGGTEVGVGDYLDKLKEKVIGFPIDFFDSPDFKSLKMLYGKAKFFWSASGFNVDEEKNPEMVEHFGITLVEAMSAGAIPIAFNAGGHKEIITNGIDGFLWNSVHELVNITSDLVDTDSSKLKLISTKAIKKASSFSELKFKEAIESSCLEYYKQLK